MYNVWMLVATLSVFFAFAALVWWTVNKDAGGEICPMNDHQVPDDLTVANSE